MPAIYFFSDELSLHSFTETTNYNLHLYRFRSLWRAVRTMGCIGDSLYSLLLNELSNVLPPLFPFLICGG